MSRTLRELGPGEAPRAAASLAELRPHVEDVAAAAEALRADGYRLLAVFEEEGGEAVAVAGFRITTMLAHGRFLYVDDLSTLPAARGRGHARALLARLAELAAQEGCASVQLDSGVGPERAAAHGLYFASGMRIASFHFSRPIP